MKFVKSLITKKNLTIVFYNLNFKNLDTKKIKINSSLLYFFNCFYSISFSYLTLILKKFGFNPLMPLKLFFYTDFLLIQSFFITYFLSLNTIIHKESQYTLNYHYSLNYKGFRILSGLPVRGQRTCSNAKTSRSIFFHQKLLKILQKYNIEPIK